MKLKGGTLLESMFAMTILVLILGISSMIYSNVLRSDGQIKKQKAIAIARKEIKKIQVEGIYIDKQSEYGQWTIKSTFESYPNVNSLHILGLTISDENGSAVLQEKHLITESL